MTRRSAGPALRVRQLAVVVLGDLAVDVVLTPDRELQAGTDVPGRITVRQGGSAANTARWLARLGARTTLIGAVGRDRAGRALAEVLRRDGVVPRLSRIARRRTGRIGVVLTAGGERSFVADRGAADLLRPEDLRPAWFAGAGLLHLPAYSLLGEPLRSAGRRAIELARHEGALVSLDLASVGPLLAGGRTTALALVATVSPDLLLATATEAAALVGAGPGAADVALDRLLELAPLVVVKNGALGAEVVARGRPGPLRLEVPTAPIETADSTGAGDAFNAGFIVAWLLAPDAGGMSAAGLRRAAVAGHRAARRQLLARRSELRLL